MTMYSVAGNNRRMKVCSVRRPPFEPRDWLVNLREDIRLALGDLDVTDHPLYALFSSEDQTPFDAENVLFYNVGMSHFSRLMTRGVTFERSLRPASELSYEMTYSVDGVVEQVWRTGQTLLECEVTLPGGAMPKFDAASVWLAIKRATNLVCHGQIGGPYGISLRLVIPSHFAWSTSSNLKGVLDGVLSAFHSYRGFQLDEVSQRLASSLQIRQSEASQFLLDDDMAVLGARRTLWPLRAGVQWNPADDLCYHCEFTTEPGDWGLHCSVYSLVENCAKQ